jgi:hypothetical protein
MATKKISPIIRIGSWLITFICFGIGFWHTHLGLKEFKVLSSSYGSLLFSAIILLAMLIAYSYAISGKKSMLIIYFIGATFFFVFNLTSFYPTYLGRT